MANTKKIGDHVYFHPGYYVQELADQTDLIPADFAMEIGLTPAELQELMNGKKDIGEPLAERLSEATGTSKAYWLNLQRTYDESAERKVANTMEQSGLPLSKEDFHVLHQVATGERTAEEIKEELHEKLKKDFARKRSPKYTQK